MRQFLPLIAVAIAACSPSEDDSPDMRTVLPSALPEPGWTIDGGDLVLHGDDGELLMRIGCTAGPPTQLTALFAGFERIGSEERLSLGLGEEVVTLVADVAGGSGAGASGVGVIASTRYRPAIGSALAHAGSISALYGTQQLGPVGPPEPRLAEGLVARCGG